MDQEGKFLNYEVIAMERIWLFMNKLKQKEDIPGSSEIFLQVNPSAQSYLNALCQLKANHLPAKSCKQWSAPLEKWVKFNFDAGFL